MLCIHAASMAARRAAEEAGRDGAKAAKANTYTGMTLQEAKQILNVQNMEKIDSIRKVQYELPWHDCNYLVAHSQPSPASAEC